MLRSTLDVITNDSWPVEVGSTAPCASKATDTVSCRHLWPNQCSPSWCQDGSSFHSYALADLANHNHTKFSSFLIIAGTFSWNYLWSDSPTLLWRTFDHRNRFFTPKYPKKRRRTNVLLTHVGKCRERLCEWQEALSAVAPVQAFVLILHIYIWNITNYLSSIQSLSIYTTCNVLIISIPSLAHKTQISSPNQHIASHSSPYTEKQVLITS